MKRLLTLLPLLLFVGFVAAAPTRPRPEIMGITLEMSREVARARLQSIGSLEREDRKRQEVWTVKDARISHLLVGYDMENRVRYVTAIARPDGPHIRYQEVADTKSAQRMAVQGNHKLTWEVDARRGRFGYVIIARGHDPEYLDSYSVKKADQEEID
jgi:hypothetical protein